MAYRNDPDLYFLSCVDSQDMNDLVKVLTYDTNGIKRLTEELTNNNNYIRYSPDHHKYWEDIAAEIQCFGANTFITIFRGGKGVLYNEVLKDVCDKIKVNYNKNSETITIENNLLMKLLMDALNKMTPDERANLGKEFGILWNNIYEFSPIAMATLFQTIFKAGGFKSYQLTLVIVNSIWKAMFGRGLTLATNATITRAAAILTGPIGWIITGLWTAMDIAGPAYRVTIPAVIQVALLRKKYLPNAF